MVAVPRLGRGRLGPRRPLGAALGDFQTSGTKLTAPRPPVISSPQVRLGDFARRKAEIWALARDAKRLGALRANAARLRASHFTYAGVMDQIARLLARGNATDGTGTDLRCAPRSPLGGPLCEKRDCVPPWAALRAASK